MSLSFSFSLRPSPLHCCTITKQTTTLPLHLLLPQRRPNRNQRLPVVRCAFSPVSLRASPRTSTSSSSSSFAPRSKNRANDNNNGNFRNGRRPNNNNNNNNNNNGNSRDGRRANRTDNDRNNRKKHWKQGEFPGTADKSYSSPTPRRTPIKNLKKKLDRKEKAKAWVPNVSEVFSDHVLNKQWLQALQLLDILRQQPYYQPKESTYMKLIVLLGRCGQPQRARQLFDEMHEEGLEPTPKLYTALLGAYCRNNLLDDAFSTLNHMKALPPCQPDAYTYSILIKSCVDTHRFDLVEALYREMSDRLMSPNTATQNTVLSGYGRLEMYDEMEKVLSGMLESRDCKPDVWTLNIILHVFGSKGHIELMEKWYEKFCSFGVQPETRTFNILIGAYGKKRMYDKMSSVMEHMRKLQFPWTTSTFNSVIEAFADVGDAKNLEYTFNQMLAEGIRTDTKTFCCLVYGYANAGLFYKVFRTVQLAAKHEIPENKALYNAVISACAKAEDLMEMERVFNRMKENKCHPDSQTYSTMVEAYRKEGMNDKIYYLEQEKQEMIANGSMSA